MAAIAYPPARPGTGLPKTVRPHPHRRSRTFRRRRLVALALSALLPGGIAGVVQAGRAGAEAVRSTLGSGARTAPESARTHHIYVVAPGDTLWDVARATHPQGDLRAAVDRLAKQHGRAPLQPGERIQW